MKKHKVELLLILAAVALLSWRQQPIPQPDPRRNWSKETIQRVDALQGAIRYLQQQTGSPVLVAHEMGGCNEWVRWVYAGPVSQALLNQCSQRNCTNLAIRYAHLEGLDFIDGPYHGESYRFYTPVIAGSEALVNYYRETKGVSDSYQLLLARRPEGWQVRKSVFVQHTPKQPEWDCTDNTIY